MSREKDTEYGDKDIGDEFGRLSPTFPIVWVKS